jgi:hypothetical protein
MKIPLQIKPDGSIYATVTVRAQKYHFFGIKDFYVDTGSPTTYIGEKDARELNIPFKTLTRKDNIIRIGGTNFFAYELKNVKFGFTNDTGKIEYFVLDTQAIKGSKIRTEAREMALALPSAIGNDFLIKNKFKLYHNPLKKESYLLSVED